MQALGGSFTVVIHGNMARIEAKDADAIGKETAAASPPSPPRRPKPAGPLEEEQVLERAAHLLRSRKSRQYS